MTITLIDTGLFKLDGGAMFGVVPKSMWARLNPPDDNNLCTWAMRCLLIETQGRKILVDTGIGDKQDARFRSHFEPHGEDSLLGSLAAQGVAAEDITDVFFTHLHFDHSGGALRRDAAGQIVPTFPNAIYWTNERHYAWACAPNAREQASFLQENFVPLHDAGLLRFIPIADGEDFEWLPGIRLRLVHGHTEAMMMLFLDAGEHTFVYCADLIASSHHVGLPYVMSYDVRPLLTLAEKARLLAEATQHGYRLIFEHDPRVAYATVAADEKGRVRLAEVFEQRGRIV